MSSPEHSFGRTTRGQAHKVFLSANHIREQLGTQGPDPGAPWGACATGILDTATAHTAQLTRTLSRARLMRFAWSPNFYSATCTLHAQATTCCPLLWGPRPARSGRPHPLGPWARRTGSKQSTSPCGPHCRHLVRGCFALPRQALHRPPDVMAAPSRLPATVLLCMDCVTTLVVEGAALALCQKCPSSTATE